MRDVAACGARAAATLANAERGHHVDAGYIGDQRYVGYAGGQLGLERRAHAFATAGDYFVILKERSDRGISSLRVAIPRVCSG